MFFGRPCVRPAHALDLTPVVTGWSLGGLSTEDRKRLVAFVMADPRRGTIPHAR